jgi:hypothetical protein
MNDKIKKLCLDFDGFLHCSASANAIDWHALQCRQKQGPENGLYKQEMRSEAGHPTPEAAIEACLASEWREVSK